MYTRSAIQNKFDPRTIFLSSLLLFSFIAFTNNINQMIFFLLLILIHSIVVGIKIEYFLKIFIASIWLLLSIVFINYFLIGRDTQYIIILVLRLFGLILLSSVFLSSLSIMDIGFAIEECFYFLRYIKIPVYVLSSVIVLSLKFIVLIKEEALRIQKAQKARGLDFKLMSIKDKLYNIINLFIPIIIFSIQSSIKIAIAMEIRGYSSNYKKTRLYKSYMKVKDYIYLSFIIIFFIVCYFLFLKNI